MCMCVVRRGHASRPGRQDREMSWLPEPVMKESAVIMQGRSLGIVERRGPGERLERSTRSTVFAA
jgi:hypothetical protein